MKTKKTSTKRSLSSGEKFPKRWPYGLKTDVANVFHEAEIMQGANHPDDIEDDKTHIRLTHKRLLKLIASLMTVFALTACGGPPFAAPLFGAEELGAGGKAESATATVASSTAQSTAETSSTSEEAASSSTGSTHPIATSSAATGTGGAGGGGGGAASVASSTGEGGASPVASSSTITEAASSTAASTSSGSGGASPCEEGPIEAPDGEHKCFVNSAHTFACPTNSPAPRDGCVYAGPVTTMEDMWCCT